MISFKSRCEAIRNADRITRAVNSIYPHISETKTKEFIGKKLICANIKDASSIKYTNLALKYYLKIKTLRHQMTSGIELLKNIIRSLKDAKIGNCYEDARLAEIIGKINGQNNIYPMKIFVTRNQSGCFMPIDHVVAVITNKSIVAREEKNEFKNNEAIIIDPWLGVTEYAGKYIELLKNNFSKRFSLMPDNEYSMRFCIKNSKNIREFKQNRKNKIFNPEIRFLLHSDGIVTEEEAENLRQQNPELILKGFKKINL